MAFYDEGVRLFNGTGFVDLPYTQPGPQHHQYQTYKLALYVYASIALDQPINMTVLSILLSMQDSDGGFYTGYNGSYSSEGTLTNSETTSLAILALESIQSQEPP